MSSSSQNASPRSRTKTPLRARQIEGREWWLWGFAVIVTVALTAGIVFLTFFADRSEFSGPYGAVLREWVRGLAACVLLFDLYTMYQHLQLQRVRRQLAERDELFQLITENAADMIAVVDATGARLYNSPAYQKVLGYSSEELAGGSSDDQIHPSDRERVAQAAQLRGSQRFLCTICCHAGPGSLSLRAKRMTQQQILEKAVCFHGLTQHQRHLGSGKLVAGTFRRRSMCSSLEYALRAFQIVHSEQDSRLEFRRFHVENALRVFLTEVMKQGFRGGFVSRFML